MAFIDGKGLVGQAKVFATEREVELDSQLSAANAEIKRLRAIIEAPADGPCMCDWCVATRDAANEKNARLGAALDATKEKP